MVEGGLTIDISFLRTKLAFPVTAYVKENGFLGMVSYNPETDNFFIASKSTPDGDFAGYLRALFEANCSAPKTLKEYLKANNVTLVFECVDMVNDPHIIKYDKSHLFLLDVVKNDINFEKLPYSDVQEVGRLYGFEVKTKAATFENWEEFSSWYNEVTDDDYLYDGHEIEGFVVEDSTGFMVKIKLAYYRFWKHMRTVAQETLRSGNYRRTGELITPMANRFFGFCKDLSKLPEHPTHIIELREMFLNASQQ